MPGKQTSKTEQEKKTHRFQGSALLINTWTGKGYLPTKQAEAAQCVTARKNGHVKMALSPVHYFSRQPESHGHGWLLRT